MILGAAVGSSLLATALTHGPKSSSGGHNGKKPSSIDRVKKKSKKLDLQRGLGHFHNGIDEISTSTPISKEKHSKFRVPLESYEDDMRMSKATEPLAIDKLLRQVVNRRFQPFK